MYISPKSLAHGFGDAIVPQVAKAFIEAYLATEQH